MTNIFADVFCYRDKKQAAAMLLPKRFRTNADYFLLHLVRTTLRPSPPRPPQSFSSSDPKEPLHIAATTTACQTHATHPYKQTQGYKLGVAATLAVWVVWDCVVQVAKFGKPTIVAKMGFPVFRGRWRFSPFLLLSRAV